MDCASCGRANRPNARFCGGCGAALAPRCSACGAEAERDARFCEACGAALPAAPAAAAAASVERKVVTIVFADLIGSTALQERLDAEAVSRVMDRYHRAVRAPVEAHGGTVVQLLGDGVMCAFGVPHVAEDDAIRAVRAAVAVQQAFREFLREHSELAEAIGLRVAVNTGEVVTSDDYAAGIGDPLNVAAHLQREARDGDVLIGESTRRLVSELVTLAPIGAVSLKGRSGSVSAYRVVSLDRPAGASATPFVGREGELRRLRAVYDAAVADQRAKLAVILGSPGLGKSRVLGELARRLEDTAIVLTARCDPAGAGTFAPLASALRTLLRLDDTASIDASRAAVEAVLPTDDSERDRIATGIAALLAGTPAPPEETFFVVRRFLGAFAAAGPVVLAIDDLHWAEPLLLDLTEHLVQWSTEVPLLVLVAARPELREVRAALAAPGGVVAEVVTLAGLDAGAATRLAANAIGADELPAAVAGRVLAASEGNPLFVGELVRMLVHDGALVREGDHWEMGVELSSLEMPPTIQALLAARIEKLRPEERTVLERAAVIGRQFSRAAVKELLPREAPDLDRQLEALRRSELVESDTGWFLGEPALRFHHALIRDAAYRRLLKNTRAELHARFADWVVGRVGDAAPHDETIGWHLEQAHQHLRELGPIDAQGRALGERASRHLAAAGRRALARDDVPVAASLLGRALDRLEPADPARAELALDWCEALLAAGEVGTAERAIDELGRFTEGSERLRAWHTCFAGERAALTDPKSLRTTADAVAAAAVVLTAAGDGAGEAKAHYVHAIALARLGKVGACEAALDRALAAARRVRDRRRSNAVLSGAPLAALWGPSPVTRASGRCLDVVRVLRITQVSPAVEAVALRCQGVLEALRGRSEAARRMIASSRRMVEELGITHRLLQADQFTGQIELIEGDPVAAERSLRTAYEGMRELGLGSDAAQAAAQLGRALLAQGRAAEAEALSHESEALAGDDLHSAIAWRGVRAEALARRGESAAAVELARSAVEIASATDALLFHADARLALAAALRSAGRSGEAAAEEARAVELWEAKGATLLAERARQGGARTESVVLASSELAAPDRPVKRRVQENAATAHAARLQAVVSARDADALPTLFVDDHVVIDHPTGTEYGRDGALLTFHALRRFRDLNYRIEPLATLGDSLALCRELASASGIDAKDMQVGPYESEKFLVIEADPHGRARRVELFAANQLGDTVVRLYELYAELLPDGPERERAAATARSVAIVLGRQDNRWAPAIASDVEAVDHRLLGLGSARGSERFLRASDALYQDAENVTILVDDVLALRDDALLLMATTTGTARVGGGIFERQFIRLQIFGVDGLVTQHELFDSDRAAHALARFDELTSEPARPARRVRPNAASDNAKRVAAALTARDREALPSLLADEIEVIDHPTGTSYDRSGALATYHSLMNAREPRVGGELLATIGEQLALHHSTTGASGFSGGTLDVGPYEREEIFLFEVDEHRRRRRVEIFGADRLADAITRLYERHAELLPEGPDRERVAATARSVSIVLGPTDHYRWAPAIASDLEFVDHRLLGMGSARGSELFLRGLDAVYEDAENVTNPVDDVLALRDDVLLVLRTTTGTARVGGGVFERQFISLWIFGIDGLVRQHALFDTSRADAALARFDALTATSPAVKRRVRPNAATANVARMEAAITARDLDAIAAHVADTGEVVDHPMGQVHDREQSMRTWRALVTAEGGTYRHEALATLGDSLALCRQWASASGLVRGKLDVGRYEIENVVLVEADAQERRRHTEIFAADRLGDALVRLYERYAELLPAGSERTRAVATARAVAAFVGPFDRERVASVIAADVTYADRRTLGLPTVRGAEAFLQGVAIQFGVASGITRRIDDVIAARPGALLARLTSSGTIHASGGEYEHHYLTIHIYDADGRVSRIEWFDLEREAEALARFDDFAAAAAAPARRAVLANAATAFGARVDAAVAARDSDAIDAQVAEHAEMLDHRTGRTLGREERLSAFRALLTAAREPVSRHEPLASLGSSLALLQQTLCASGFSGQTQTLSAAAYRIEELCVVEADRLGRCARADLFALDRLGDAVARLYERYAELLPERNARAHAAAIARSVATVLGPPDPDSVRPALALDVRYADHRALGWGPARGVVAFVRALRTLRDALGNVEAHTIELLAARADALLVRRTVAGELTDGGGRYRRRPIVLWVFGAGGRITHWEQFDGDQSDEALARFEELAAPPVRARIVESTATAAIDRFDRAWARRDWKSVAALYAAGFRYSDRRTLMELELDREGFLEFVRPLFEMNASLSLQDVLATRGDRLVLIMLRFEYSGGDVGPSETESLMVIEVDTSGDRVALVRFDAGALQAAHAELDARYAAGEAIEHPAMWAALWDVRRALAAHDWDRLTSLVAAEFAAEDHRLLGWGTARSAEQYAAAMRPVTELRPDVALRLDHLLLADRVALFVASWTGSEATGPFEIPVVIVFRAGPDGRIDRIHHYGLEQLDAARARFAELVAPPAPERLIETTATRAIDRFDRTWATRDWEAIAALHAPGFRYDDRVVQLDLDRERWLAFARTVFDMGPSRISSEVLATRGDRLVVVRSRVEVADGSVGPSEIASLVVSEVDRDGRRLAMVRFDVDVLDAATAELDARYAAGEAAAFPHVAETMRAFREAFERRDWGALAARMAPDVVVDDHRLLGWETVRGADAYVQTLHSLVDLAPDTRLRLDHVETSQRGLLWIGAWVGTRDGGEFETPWITVSEHDARGVVLRFDQYDLDQLPAARARFQDLRPDPLLIPPNAATRAWDRFAKCVETGAWDELRALSEPAAWEDRRSLIRTSGDREMIFANAKLVSRSGARVSRKWLATSGERLALEHLRFSRSERRGAYEIAALAVIEADADGRLAAVISFDSDDRRAAFEEMAARFLAGEAAPIVGQTAVVAFDRAFGRDADLLRACIAERAVICDRGSLSLLGTLGRDEYVESVAAFAELAPDLEVESLRILVWNERGRVDLARRFGTRDGGPFENFFARVFLTGGDRIQRFEMFDADAADEALARFAELCAES